MGSLIKEIVDGLLGILGVFYLLALAIEELIHMALRRIKRALQ